MSEKRESSDINSVPPQILERRKILQWWVALAVSAVLWDVDAKPKTHKEIKKIDEINAVRRIVKDGRGRFSLWTSVREEYVDEVARPIASISKLMMALVVYDICRERGYDVARHQIFLDDTDKEKARSRNRRVPSGKYYTIEQLLDMALIKSTNEAAEALATGIVARVQFIARMNQKAKQLGMMHTHFDNPSWISSGNKSTVHDLEKLAVAILNSPYPIGRTTQYESVVIPQLRGKNKKLGSANRITLWKIRELWAEVVLTKTGFIKPAGRCEVTVFKVPSGNIYSLVLLDADTDGERKRAVWSTIAELVKKG